MTPVAFVGASAPTTASGSRPSSDDAGPTPSTRQDAPSTTDKSCLVIAEPISYDASAKAFLAASGHYLKNTPPGALFAIGLFASAPGLFGDPVATGPLLGLCLVGRPTCRHHPQGGGVGEITRMVLAPRLPHGAASLVLRRAAEVAKRRGMSSLIAYHDRTRHTGCIYRKAGFSKDGVTRPRAGTWGSRPMRKSAELDNAPKRRWRMDLTRG